MGEHARTEWRIGDRLMHRQRPEWGVGRVLSATFTTHDGKPCQRLNVKFDREGLKTLSTGVADLKLVEESAVAAFEIASAPIGRPLPERAPVAVGAAASSPSESPFAAATRTLTVKEITALPESVADPFTSRKARLEATLNLYRFSDRGASLLDWASVQTGLKDPLTQYSRHELEQHFRRFAYALEQHLRKLVREIRRAEPGVIAEVAAKAGPDERQALRRADMER